MKDLSIACVDIRSAGLVEYKILGGKLLPVPKFAVY